MGPRWLVTSSAWDAKGCPLLRAVYVQRNGSFDVESDHIEGGAKPEPKLLVCVHGGAQLPVEHAVAQLAEVLRWSRARNLGRASKQSVEVPGPKPVPTLQENVYQRANGLPAWQGPSPRCGQARRYRSS